MRKLMKNVLIATTLIAGSAVPVLADDDVDVKLDDVGQQAKTTIEKQVGKDGKIEDIEREQRKSKTVYEVEYRDAKGAKYEIVVAEDGKLLDKRPE
ncbi:MAG TPA: PepSY domain-containing protein [Kofleriaceae bacterium]|jgi:uncharacterized protein YpmB|nr:PepSY domain-containing protein [Kofleriaceae bacterium]